MAKIDWSQIMQAGGQVLSTEGQQMAAKKGGVPVPADAGKKDKPTHGGGQKSWLTSPQLGPIPGYGVVIGGVGVAGLLGLLIKRILFRR